MKRPDSKPAAAGPKPSMIQLLKPYSRLIAGLLLFSLGIALWVLIPFYDATKESGQRGRNAHYFGLVAVILLLATTAIGYWTIR